MTIFPCSSAPCCCNSRWWGDCAGGVNCRPCESRDLPCCMSSSTGAPPGLARPEHGIGEDDEAAEHGDERQLGRFAVGDEPLVKGTQHRIVSASSDGRHVEDAAHGRSTAVDSCRSAHGAAFADEWSNTDECGCRFVVDPAEFGDGGKQAQRRLHSDSLDGFKKPLIAPQVDALTDQLQHHPMYLLVFGTERLKMSRDRLAEFGQPHRAEPAGL